MAPRWTLICAGIWMLVAVGGGHFLEDHQQIVHLHNQYRSVVEPPAADMTHMKWSQELAAVAVLYATKCIWEHNPDVKNTMGENLFITTGTIDIEKALSDWFGERMDYTYDNNTCSEDKMCGHYTQMVWARTNRIGCGTHFCESVEGLHFEKATMMVCNYFPPGNVIGHKPYEAGEPCSKCPVELGDCVDQICDSTARDEFPSLEPTELWMTDMPHTWPVEWADSGSGRPCAALLLLSGLLASLVWL
ncbi:peptidase inhibitor 16 [Salminus brasiliensis]|uniref:peptidase inhibitor 16 n=1 Tax=Salminus brasiliensis TaxID=930266 RepID=UPI003B839C2B